MGSLRKGVDYVDIFDLPHTLSPEVRLKEGKGLLRELFSSVKGEEFVSRILTFSLKESRIGGEK